MVKLFYPETARDAKIPPDCLTARRYRVFFDFAGIKNPQSQEIQESVATTVRIGHDHRIRTTPYTIVALHNCRCLSFTVLP